jgi:effector-binding domain-containing protein/carbon monoxide dehydrogenase subunit G
MTFAKKAALGVAAVGGAVLLASLFLPTTARVERSIVVEAPQATVFTVLNGFRQFDKWSPWADLDPAAQTTYEGPAFGVGAKMSWAGNDAVGTGSQEIIESTAHSAIRLRLGFGGAPGAFTSTYALQPVDGGTRVTWAFDADYAGSIVGRWFGLLTGRMVGPDYDTGLQRLKALVEAMPKGDFSALSFEPVEVDAVPAVMTSVRSAADPTAIGLALGVAYSRLFGYLSVQGLQPAAPSVAIYRADDGGTLTIDAAVPVDRAPASVSGGVRVGQLPAGPAVRAEYRGAYAGLPAARAQLEAYLAAAGLERAGPIWEQYVGDPKAPEAERVTHIYSPIRRSAS